MSLSHTLNSAAEQLALRLEPTQRDQLLALLDALMTWNKAFNLTSIRNHDEALILHILDSLSIASMITGPQLLDVGTGPGFPALPVAIVRPHVKVVALDSNNKKIRFIRQMAYELKLDNIEPVQSRVEDYHGQFAQITSRAFTELDNFIALTDHLLAPDGEWLAMKSQSAAQEKAQLSSSLHAEIIPLTVPYLNADRCVVRVTR